jgi:hypothetical protein
MPQRASFDPESQTTDPWELYVAPPPKDGINVQGHVERAMKARISTIVQDKRLGFETESSYVRSAVHWFTEQIVAPRMGGGFEADMRQATLFVRNAQALARLHNASRFYKDVRVAILELANEDAWEEAISIWQGAVDHAAKREEPFRSKVLQHLNADPEFEVIRQKARAQVAAVNLRTNED